MTARVGARITQSWQLESDRPLAEALNQLAPFAETGVFVPTRQSRYQYRMASA